MALAGIQETYIRLKENCFLYLGNKAIITAL